MLIRIMIETISACYKSLGFKCLVFSVPVVLNPYKGFGRMNSYTLMESCLIGFHITSSYNYM